MSLSRRIDEIFNETKWQQWKNCAQTRAETRHVIATKFQPGKRAGISARAEIRHVITPLVGLLLAIHKLALILTVTVDKEPDHRHTTLLVAERKTVN